MVTLEVFIPSRFLVWLICRGRVALPGWDTRALATSLRSSTVFRLRDHGDGWGRDRGATDDEARSLDRDEARGAAATAPTIAIDVTDGTVEDGSPATKAPGRLPSSAHRPR